LIERFDLDGKAIVVTGGGRGLGRGMAMALAEAGAQVLIASRTEEQLAGVTEEIRAAGGKADYFVFDATKSADVDALVQDCVLRYGQIDVMFANAGGGQGPDLEFWEFPDDGFQATMEQNLHSVFYAARAASAQMMKQGTPGVVVPTASGSALRGRLPFAYPTAKGGVLSLTRSMAMTLAAHNIRVNTIVPGYVSQRPPKDAQEQAVREQRGSFVPVKRLGEWWELGPLAIFLASEASSYITGAQFIIDGGGLAAGLGPVGFRPRHEV